MVKKSNGWNLQEMQETLVKDTEQRISDGFHKIVSEQGENGTEQSPDTNQLARQQKFVKDIKHMGNVKGVQTYISMDDYKRLMNFKLQRGGTIANLVAESVSLWLDVQEERVTIDRKQGI